MLTAEEIIDYVSDNNPNATIFTHPDFNDAIVGWVENSYGFPVVCYSYYMMVESLAQGYADSEDPIMDAFEWIDYNTLRTLPYIDEIGRPVILYN
jgi:hypothetical protein